MKLAIIHLSDIHANHADDPFVASASPIASAIRAHQVLAETSDALIVLSGDLTYSGQPAQFELVERWIDAIRDELNQSGINTHLFVAPGNHDSVLIPERRMRTLAIRAYKEGDFSAEFLADVAEPQENFWRFAKRVGALAPTIETPVLVWDKTAKIGDRTVSIRGINTAWCSLIPELEASLILPSSELEKIERPDDDHIAISVFHHPYRWLTQMHAADAAAIIESWSDIVLTGHEHRPGTQHRNTPDRPERLYVEGGAIQLHGAKSLEGSAFGLVELDTASASYSLHVLSARGGVFVPLQEQRYLDIPLGVLRRRARARFALTAKAIEYSNDVGDLVSHPRAPSKMRLLDIYVPPLLEDLTDAEATHEVDSAEIVKLITEHQRITIVGKELSGKTALLRYAAVRTHQSGLMPVHIDARALAGGGAAARAISQAVDWQYGTTTDALKSALADLGVALVDNIDAVSIRDQDRLLRECARRFRYLVATTSAFQAPARSSGGAQVWRASQFSIRDFTHSQRGALVRKWMEYGRDETLEDGGENLVRATASRDALLSQTIRNQVIPSTPHFVLMCLSFLEAKAGEDDPNASHGFLYQALIMAAIGATPGPAAEVKLDYLTALAGEMWTLTDVDKRRLSDDEFSRWNQRTWADRGIRINSEQMVRVLVDARVLRNDSGFLEFRYRNAYCFCLARWMSESMTDTELEATVGRLTEMLHLEECHLTLMFLAHLDRRAVVFNKLRMCSDAMFAEAREDCVAVSAANIVRTLQEFPVYQLPGGTIAEVRDRMLQQADEGEALAGSVPPDSTEDTVEHGGRLVRDLQIGMRLVYTTGQLLRRHAASVSWTREDKVALVDACRRLTLRMASTFFGVVGDATEEWVESIVIQILSRHNHSVDSVAELRSEARRTLQNMMVHVATALLVHASDAVSTSMLVPTLEAATRGDESFSASAFDLAVRLETDVRMPKLALDRTAAAAGSSAFSKAILTRIVYRALTQYLYRQQEIELACQTTGIKKAPKLVNTSRKKVY